MATFRTILRELGYSAAAVLLALAAGALLLALAGYDISEAYFNLYDGAFGNIYSVADTLLNAVPLVFTGLSVAFAFRGGLFNIGAEGQMYLGALASALAALGLSAALAPFGAFGSFLIVSGSLLAGAAAGALWGFIPGYLRARTGAHEVITTIMLNYTGTLLTTYLVKNYFKAPGPVDQTALIPPAARLPELIPTTRLTWALFLALAVAAFVQFVFKRTALGYDIQVVGRSPQAAAYAGIPLTGRITLTMTASGAISGLAGSTLVLGVLHRFITNFSPGYGFTGIAVAVLARSHPWAVVPAAVLFGALQSGGLSMQLFARIPADLMTVVQGLVILFVSAPALVELVSKGFAGVAPRNPLRPPLMGTPPKGGHER